MMHRFRNVPTALAITSDADFSLLLRKELARHQRRADGFPFALLSVRADRHDSPQLAKWITKLRNRLRITDELGHFQGAIGVLLPDTDREGALHVTDIAYRYAESLGLKLRIDVSVYPWDDDIGGTAHQPCDVLTKLTDRRGGLRTESGEPVESLSEPVAAVSVQPLRGPLSTPFWKRAIDLSAVLLTSVVTLPLVVVLAFLIKRTSEGPVFFTQLREGKDGKRFRIYKFRTMRPDAEALKGELRKFNEQDGPAFKMRRDPRVTSIGYYLRISCLDELPQLWNVVRCEMSLVGPRPLPVDESVACKPWQRERLRVLPGITGIWQCRKTRDVSFDQWMRMDLQYVARSSFWLDLRLILRTVVLALRHRGSA